MLGDWGAGNHTVSVNFLNDAWGGTSATDRNLYVDAASYNGAAVENASRSLLSAGSQTFTFQETAPAAGPATTSTLTLRVAEDAYQGDAAFAVFVDGVQVGGTQTATASHAAGAWQDISLSGAFSASPNSVEVRFLNDAWGGSAATDRNLYVDALILGGNTYQAEAAANSAGSTVGTAAALMSNGSLIFDTSTAPASSAPPAQSQTASNTSTAPVSSAPPAQSQTTSGNPGLSLLGVNLAGAMFSGDKIPGVFGTDYTYPTHDEIDYYAAKGLNVFRLGFLWERLQPSMNGPLDTAELARINDVVSYATSKGLKVVLEPHNYGSGYNNVIGSAGAPNSAFADFWGKLAGHFAGNANVMFGLMNEPYKQDATQWLASANAAIKAIRDSGATSQEILVPGAYWDGAHNWVSSDNDTVVGTGIVDPAQNYAFEVHQYLDADSSGTSPNVVSTTVGVERLTAITQWAESNHARLFLGEFGVAQDATSLKAMDNMLAYMDQHAVWQGATYWAAGPWWGDYMYSIEPAGLGTGQVTDKPQMGVLEHYVA